MSFDLSFDLDSKGAHEKVAEFFSHATNASRPCGVTPKHLSKIWTSHRKMLEELLIPQLKHLFEHRILLCHATMALMIACSDTNIYRTISLWIHSLPLRKGMINPWAHMLPTLCRGQRLLICRANVKEIRSPSSD